MTATTDDLTTTLTIGARYVVDQQRDVARALLADAAARRSEQPAVARNLADVADVWITLSGLLANAKDWTAIIGDAQAAVHQLVEAARLAEVPGEEYQLAYSAAISYIRLVRATSN